MHATEVIPPASAAAVRAALEDTAVATVSASWGEYINYGKIDCDAAVDRVTGVTSGSKTARFLFAAPVGGDRTRDPTLAMSDPRQSIRFFTSSYGGSYGWCGSGKLIQQKNGSSAATRRSHAHVRSAIQSV